MTIAEVRDLGQRDQNLWDYLSSDYIPLKGICFEVRGKPLVVVGKGCDLKSEPYVEFFVPSLNYGSQDILFRNSHVCMQPSLTELAVLKELVKEEPDLVLDHAKRVYGMLDSVLLGRDFTLMKALRVMARHRGNMVGREVAKLDEFYTKRDISNIDDVMGALYW
jgi:hypothetical protein